MSYNEEFEPTTGVLDFEDESKHLDDEDYVGTDLSDFPTPPSNYYVLQHQFNQRDVHKNSCVPTSILGEIIDMTGRMFDVDDMTASLDYIRRKNAFREESGMKVSDGYRLTNHWVRANATDLTDKYFMSYHIILFGSDLFFGLLDKGYSIGVTYRGNRAYNEDRNIDSMLDGVDFGSTTYGHKLTAIKDRDSDDHFILKDNYKGRPSNLYKIPKEHAQALVDNNHFYANARVWKFVRKKPLSLLGHVFEEEVTNPVLKMHEGDGTMTESDIRYLLEIFGHRLESRIKKWLTDAIKKAKNNG